MNNEPQTVRPAPGRYRHFKGAYYQVMDVARHSETEEMYVIYSPLYKQKELWIRPLSDFCATVQVDGRTVPRFQPVSDEAC